MKLPAVLLVVIALAACTPAQEPEVISPTLTPDPTPRAAVELIYAQGRELRVLDLATGESARVTELPSEDVAVSPDGGQLVAVQESHPQGPGPEGFRRPVLVIASTGAEETPSELGPGRSPVWASNSAAVAAIAPGERGEEIVVYQLPGAPVTTAAPTDEQWSLVGWQGPNVVAIGSRSGVVSVPGNGEPISKWRVAPAGLWGVSPADSSRLVVGDRGAVLAAKGATDVDGLEGTPGDGAWSWDGRHIAVSELAGGNTSLALIDTSSAEATEVRVGRGAQGNVVWSADGSRFAFVRVDPRARGKLQAVVCTIELVCEPTFSWIRGVRLLAFR
jgi:Tol biopolymer transport system component